MRQFVTRNVLVALGVLAAFRRLEAPLTAACRCRKARIGVLSPILMREGLLSMPAMSSARPLPNAATSLLPFCPFFPTLCKSVHLGMLAVKSGVQLCS